MLDLPGECDLSAYVNFMSLASAAQKVPGSKIIKLLNFYDMIYLL